MSGAAFRGIISPAMARALALVAGGLSQRKAAAAAGVSLAGIVKALRRRKEAQK